MAATNAKKDSWNASLYDGKHAFVSELGSPVLDLLAPREGEMILDLGCGTGDLAKKLADQGVQVTGVDKSPNMIQQAKQKYPSLLFHEADATALPYEQTFDAVFSNATLHWVQPPDQALHSIWNSLKTGGRFVAEFGGKGNVAAISSTLIAERNKHGYSFSPELFPWYYPSIGEYTALMEQAGFHVMFAAHIDRPTPLDGTDGLKNWIRMFGSALLDGVPEAAQHDIIRYTEMQLRATHFQQEQNRWIADYKRIRVVGVKE